MSDPIRAELFKLAKRPAAWVLLAAAVVLNQVFRYVIPYVSYRSNGSGVVAGVSKADLLASTLPAKLVGNSIGGFPVFAGALALVLGALVFGSEYGWGTVKTLFTQRPARIAVLGGQVGALAVATLVGVLALFLTGALTAAGIAAIEDQPMAWPSVLHLVEGIAAGWLIVVVWALLGGLLAVALRGVALPIGLGVVWVLGIENIVSAVAGSVLTSLRPLRDVLPGVNAGSLVSSVSGRLVDPPPGVTASVGGGRALITLGAYLVLCLVAAAWTLRRRDVA